MNEVLLVIDSILYFIFLVTVLYLFVFALFGLRTRTDAYPKAKKNHRIAVFFPAYKEDRVIVSSVSSFLEQQYDRSLYQVIVICDQMQPATLSKLSALGVQVLEVTFQNSSKSKALNFAIATGEGEPYQIAVVLDADNTVEPNFLEEINKAYCAGIMAMQAHRVPKNRNTNTAVLDAVSSEINNSIFLKGHVNLGFSSGLSGSGMAFDYKWFAGAMAQIESIGEDKELELRLLKERRYIDFLDHVIVLDEKTQSSASFYAQRRRWMAAQLESLRNTLPHLPQALASGNFDFCNKVLQWMLFPRSIVLVVLVMMSIVMLFVDWIHALKWWGLLLLMLFTLSAATPNYLVDAKFYKAMRTLPLLSMMMVVNLFRLRGASKKFIHTDHSH